MRSFFVHTNANTRQKAYHYGKFMDVAQVDIAQITSCLRRKNNINAHNAVQSTFFCNDLRLSNQTNAGSSQFCDDVSKGNTTNGLNFLA